MNLDQLYTEIMTRSREKILAGEEQIDDFIDDSTDTRMGLTLVIRPTRDIQERIVRSLKQIEDMEAGQYYYPASDFHITLFDIITARQDFQYTKEQKEKCIALSESILSEAQPFQIQLKGMILSEGCIMVKGYYENEMEKIRQQLRLHISDFGLTLDERYPTKSSHITVGRFRKPLMQREKLVEQIEKLGKYEFGTFAVRQVDLVCHNWYDSKKEVIQTFELN